MKYHLKAGQSRVGGTDWELRALALESWSWTWSNMVATWMGDHYMLCACPEISPESKSVQLDDINWGPPCTCIHMQKDHISKLKLLWSMSEFSGLRKQQNNSACTKSVRAFKLLRLDTIWKKNGVRNSLQKSSSSAKHQSHFCTGRLSWPHNLQHNYNAWAVQVSDETKCGPNAEEVCPI